MSTSRWRWLCDACHANISVARASVWVALAATRALRAPWLLMLRAPLCIARAAGAFLEFSPKYVMFSGWVGDQDPTFPGMEDAMINIIYSAWFNYTNFGADIGACCWRACVVLTRSFGSLTLCVRCGRWLSRRWPNAAWPHEAAVHALVPTGSLLAVRFCRPSVTTRARVRVCVCVCVRALKCVRSFAFVLLLCGRQTHGERRRQRAPSVVLRHARHDGLHGQLPPVRFGAHGAQYAFCCVDEPALRCCTVCGILSASRLLWHTSRQARACAVPYLLTTGTQAYAAGVSSISPRVRR